MFKGATLCRLLRVSLTLDGFSRTSVILCGHFYRLGGTKIGVSRKFFFLVFWVCRKFLLSLIFGDGYFNLWFNHGRVGV